MHKIYLFAAAMAFAALSCSSPTESDLTAFVDPFIGTAAHGHVFPGATPPFGMVQLSTDNGSPG